MSPLGKTSHCVFLSQGRQKMSEQVCVCQWVPLHSHTPCCHTEAVHSHIRTGINPALHKTTGHRKFTHLLYTNSLAWDDFRVIRLKILFLVVFCISSMTLGAIYKWPHFQVWLISLIFCSFHIHSSELHICHRIKLWPSYPSWWWWW